MVNKLRTDVHIDSKNDFLRKLIKPIKFYNQVLGNSLKSNSNMIQRKKSLVKRKIKFKKENKVNENNKLNSISKKNLKKFSKENSLYINKQN